MQVIDLVSDQESIEIEVKPTFQNVFLYNKPIPGLQTLQAAAKIIQGKLYLQGWQENKKSPQNNYLIMSKFVANFNVSTSCDPEVKMHSQCQYLILTGFQSEHFQEQKGSIDCINKKMLKAYCSLGLDRYLEKCQKLLGRKLSAYTFMMFNFSEICTYRLPAEILHAYESLDSNREKISKENFEEQIAKLYKLHSIQKINYLSASKTQASNGKGSNVGWETQFSFFQDEKDVQYQSRDQFEVFRQAIFNYIDTFGQKEKYQTNRLKAFKKNNTSSYRIETLLNTISLIIYQEVKAAGNILQIESAVWTKYLKSKKKNCRQPLLKADRKDIALKGQNNLILLNIQFAEVEDDARNYVQTQQYSCNLQGFADECRKYFLYWKIDTIWISSVARKDIQGLCYEYGVRRQNSKLSLQKNE